MGGAGRTVRDVRLDEGGVDPRVLAIEDRPDRFSPHRALHALMVARTGPEVPDRSRPPSPMGDDGAMERTRGDDELRALFDAAREGDDLALATFVRRTQPAVWRLCAALGRPEDPADLAQETYSRMLRSMHTYRGEAPVQVWLLSIARRVCADAVRRLQRHRRLVDRILRAQSLDISEPAHDGTLADLLTRLSPERREVFVLTQQVGLSYEETAALLECPIGTVRSRLARARDDLQRAVDEAETA